MRTYKEVKFYEFAVEAVLKENYGRDFIYLSDGTIKTYRINLMIFK